MPDQRAAQGLRLGQQLAQGHDAALAEAAQHHALWRNTQLLRGTGHGLLHQCAGLLLLWHVDMARAIVIHRELKPGISALPHGKRCTQADHMKLRRHKRCQAKQILLIAAHAVHEHQQPGLLAGSCLGGTLQKSQRQ